MIGAWSTSDDCGTLSIYQAWQKTETGVKERQWLSPSNQIPYHHVEHRKIKVQLVRCRQSQVSGIKSKPLLPPALLAHENKRIETSKTMPQARSRYSVLKANSTQTQHDLTTSKQGAIVFDEASAKIKQFKFFDGTLVSPIRANVVTPCLFCFFVTA